MRERCHGNRKHCGNRKLLRAAGALVFLLEEREATHRDLIRRKREENRLQTFGKDVRTGVTRTHASNEFDGIRRACDIEKCGNAWGRQGGYERVEHHGKGGSSHRDPCEHSLGMFSLNCFWITSGKVPHRTVEGRPHDESWDRRRRDGIHVVFPLLRGEVVLVTAHVARRGRDSF